MWALALVGTGWAAPAEPDALERARAEVEAAAAHRTAGEHEAAVAALQRALVLRERALGPDHVDVAATLHALGMAYEESGDPRGAQPIFERSLAIRETGGEPLFLADALDAMARIHMRLGAFAAAQPLYARCLEIHLRVHGDDHFETASVRTNLASSLVQQGEFELAVPVYEQALPVLESHAGPDSPHVGVVMRNLALVYQRQGATDKARSLLERNLDICRVAYGDDHPQVANATTDLARLAVAEGDFDGARTLLEGSVAILEGAGDAHGKDLAVALNLLAQLLQKRGDLRTAHLHLDRVLALMRARYGDEHPNVDTALNNLAALLVAEGDYDAALPLYERSLAGRVSRLGPDHTDVAISLRNLGRLLTRRGDYAGARPLVERALAIWEEARGPEHLEVANGLEAVAAVCIPQGDHVAARALMERALAIRKATLRSRHPDIARSLANLAAVLTSAGDEAGARALFEQSLAMRQEALGPKHPLVVSDLVSLGRLMFRTGERAEGLRLLERALETRRATVGEAHPLFADVLFALAERMDGPTAGPHLEKVVAIRTKVLGPGHPKVAEAYAQLALVQAREGDVAAARRSAEAAAAIAIDRLTLLDALSEREGLAYVPRLRVPFDRWLVLHDRAGDHALAWTRLLRFKGAVGARQRWLRAAGAADPALAAELAGIRRELARNAFADRAGSRPPETVARREELERELLKRSASFRQHTDTGIADTGVLCEALPDDTALVDVYRYRRGEDRHYLAMVMGRDCQVHRIELGPADALEEAVTAWRQLLGQGGMQASRIDDRGARVRDLLWTPLAAAVGEADRVLLVPDGALSVAPLAALPLGDGRYLLEEVDVTYLDRANDLLLEPGPSGRGLVVVGGVAYDDGATPGATRRATAPCNRGGFDALPGTRVEAELVADRWQRKRRGEEVTRLLGDRATEEAVMTALQGKAVAHLSTHGFFASGQCASVLEGEGEVGYDPMVLSGMALAGVNHPGEAGGDGVLTAAEVATVDLTGLQLAVLSACETGLGELKSGEGVLGLRRAFRIAGARTLVTSLWAVPDEATSALMAETYRHLFRRRPPSPAEALRRAQLDMLEAQRARGEVDPYAWAAFVAAGL